MSVNGGGGRTGGVSLDSGGTQLSVTSPVSLVRGPRGSGVARWRLRLGSWDSSRVFSNLPGLFGGQEARLCCVSLILAFLSAGDW